LRLDGGIHHALHGFVFRVDGSGRVGASGFDVDGRRQLDAFKGAALAGHTSDNDRRVLGNVSAVEFVFCTVTNARRKQRNKINENFNSSSKKNVVKNILQST
jgi:hypothetical protein